MFCENCGSQIPDIARFCPNCGAEVVPAVSVDPETMDYDSVNVSSPYPEAEDHNMEDDTSNIAETGESARERHRRRVWIPIVIIVAIVVVLFFLLLQFGFLDWFASAREVDLDDYVAVEYGGYDGSGTASAVLDYTALGEEYDGKIRISRQGEEAGYGSFSEMIEDTVTVMVVPDYDLSNGDELSVEWELDTAMINELVRGQVDLLCATKVFTVQDLEVVETFDAFADVTVTFSGTAPDAAASLTVGSGGLAKDAFTISPAEGLSRGDTVTVSIDPDAAEAYMAETGLYPEKLTKEYTVEDVAGYVTSLNEIPAEDMEALKEYAEKVKTDKADDWPADEHRLDSLEYVGCYFLSEKPGEDQDDDNILYLVYKLNVTKYGWKEDGSEDNLNFDYYWYGGYSDAEILEDGSFSIDYDTFVEPTFDSNSSFVVTTYNYTEEDPDDQSIGTKYRGYRDLDSLHEDLIAPRLEAYDCESTVTE